jgi:hypothetical protein
MSNEGHIGGTSLNLHGAVQTKHLARGPNAIRWMHADAATT